MKKKRVYTALVALVFVSGLVGFRYWKDKGENILIAQEQLLETILPCFRAFRNLDPEDLGRRDRKDLLSTLQYIPANSHDTFIEYFASQHVSECKQIDDRIDKLKSETAILDDKYHSWSGRIGWEIGHPEKAREIRDRFFRLRQVVVRILRLQYEGGKLHYSVYKLNAS